MYNLLEKLRKGEAFTDKDREYNDKALVSTLKQIHDELDYAVLEAYGWQDLANDKTKEENEEIILDRLVTLNAQRAEEERNGHIRWLRPEYQAPEEVRTQTLIEGVTPPEKIAIAPAEVKTFPKQPKDQLAIIRDLLHTSSTEWTTEAIAVQFKNGKKCKAAISENLERLEWFGIINCRNDGTIKYWQNLESDRAS